MTTTTPTTTANASISVTVFERYGWTLFVLLGGFVVLIGVFDITSSDARSLAENTLNELMIGLLTIVVGAGGLRRGARWAWFAMSLCPLWVVAQSLRAWEAGKGAEAISGAVFLVIALAALALSYRVSFKGMS